MRRRLTFWNALLQALTLLVMGLTLYWSSESTLFGAIDDDLLRRANLIAAESPGEFQRRRPPGPVLRMMRPPPAGNQNEDQRRARRVQVLQALLVPQMFSPPDMPDDGGPPDGPPGESRQAQLDRAWDRGALNNAFRGLRTFGDATVSGQPVRVLYQPIMQGDKVVRVVQLGSSKASAIEELAHLRHSLYWLSPLAILFTALGGLLMTDRMMRPLRAITNKAKQIDAQKLNSKLSEDGNDEFAELARTLNAMLTRIEAGVSSQRRFVADAAHELRSPLTAIKARTSISLRGNRKLEDYKRELSAINQSTDRMIALIRQLLTLARADEGRLTLQETALGLDQIWEHVRPGVRSAERVTLAFGQPAPVVTVDLDLFGMAIRNLVENALRHTPEDKLVELGGRLVEGQCEVWVRDEGCGISPEHLPYLFDRFYRAESARDRETGGTGLGLAICSVVVDAHHGALRVHSEVGKGSLFIITLPAAPDAGAAPIEEPGESAAGA